MKNFGFLFGAYAVIWIGLSAYLVFLGVRLRRVAERLDRLEGSIRDEGVRR